MNLSNIMNKCVTRGVLLIRSNFKLPARLCSSDLKNIGSYNPDIIDKKILVHFKYYDRIEDVPSKVDQNMMGRVSFIAIYWNNKQNVFLVFLFSVSLLVFNNDYVLYLPHMNGCNLKPFMILVMEMQLKFAK